jgi:hypothetical protein
MCISRRQLECRLLSKYTFRNSSRNIERCDQNIPIGISNIAARIYIFIPTVEIYASVTMFKERTAIPLAKGPGRPRRQGLKSHFVNRADRNKYGGCLSGLYKGDLMACVDI